MAADNDDAYNLTPAFVLETVAAAKGFIERIDLGSNVTTAKSEKAHIRVAVFLAWPAERVSHALAQLSTIEDGELSKKAVESLPTIPRRYDFGYFC